MIRKNWVAGVAIAAAAAAVTMGAARADVVKRSGLNGVRLSAAPPVMKTESDGTLSLRMPRGARFPLPMEGVTRIIPANDDVARGVFDGDRAVVEGVTTGSTLVEVYQGENKRQLLSVQIDEPTLFASNSATNNTIPAPGSVVSPLPPSAGTDRTIKSTTPVVVADANPTAKLPRPDANGTTASNSNLAISLRGTPVEDNPAQTLFTITYSNRGTSPARDVVIRTALDDVVSYVKGSGTGNPTYDAASRELVWNIGALDAGTASGGTLSYRVEPIERGAATFYAVATIEDSSGNALSSNAIKWNTTPASLLTVFALPDRFLAGRNAPVFVDVQGLEFQQAIDRLQKMTVVNGDEPGLYKPNRATQRAEWAAMTLNGLNLKDLRDMTAIKFVLNRRSFVTVNIRNSAAQIVATLTNKNQSFPAGEHTLVWTGMAGTKYAPPGRYSYECLARTGSGENASLKGFINIVAQTPLNPTGVPSYSDVRASDWYAGYLAMAQKQRLMIGVGDNRFEPLRPISRVEAIAVAVRAMGMEDLARRSMNTSVGFLDYQDVPTWATGYVTVAATSAKTAGNKPIAVGYPSNFFMPNKSLRRDEAALLVQRLIDREMNRRITISGAMQPNATVTINGKTVEADENGQFAFAIEQTPEQPVLTMSTTQTP